MLERGGGREGWAPRLLLAGAGGTWFRGESRNFGGWFGVAVLGIRMNGMHGGGRG